MCGTNFKILKTDNLKPSYGHLKFTKSMEVLEYNRNAKHSTHCTRKLYAKLPLAQILSQLRYLLIFGLGKFDSHNPRI